MAAARFPASNPTNSVHTQDSIIAKLDSNITDSERKAFVSTLLQSPETALLLHDSLVAWEMQMIDAKTFITVLIEKIACIEDTLSTWSEYNSPVAVDKVAKLTIERDQSLDVLEEKQNAYDARMKNVRKMDQYSYPMLRVLEKFNCESEHTLKKNR